MRKGGLELKEAGRGREMTRALAACTDDFAFCLLLFFFLMDLFIL